MTQEPAKESQESTQESKSALSNILRLWVARQQQLISNSFLPLADRRNQMQKRPSLGIEEMSLLLWDYSKRKQQYASDIDTQQKLCKRLSTIQFDQAYCSDLNRTVKTLKPLADQKQSLKIIYSSLLREKGGGELQGLPLTQTALCAKKANVPLKEFRPKGGESWRDVYLRARKYLNIIIIQHILNSKQDANILTITHGGWIMEFLNYLKFLKKLPQNSANATKNTAIYHIKFWFQSQKADQLRDLFKKQQIFQLDFKSLLKLNEDVIQTIEKCVQFSIQYTNDNSHLEEKI